MANSQKKNTCPHCNSVLKKFQMPDEGGWNCEIHEACFNDDCEYYQRGWIWMMEKFEAKASYRYRIDPKTGVASPLPVWSPTAIKNRIVEEDNGAE